MSKGCPVCDEVLPEVVPAYCEQCGWDFKNDITFVLVCICKEVCKLLKYGLDKTKSAYRTRYKR